MHLVHTKHAQLYVVKRHSPTYLKSIKEFLISNMTFHTPSSLGCHIRSHPTTPLSLSMCGVDDDQESTKSQIAISRSGFFLSCVFLFSFVMSIIGFAPNQAYSQENNPELTVATASNFTHVLKQLAKNFTKQTGHKVNIVQGSSGGLATQIIHGLPVDMFLSADQVRIDNLIKANIALPKSRFTYAIGQLTLWSTDKSLIASHANRQDITKLFSNPSIHQIATANPKLAPYGLAAHQTINALGLNKALEGKIIYGQNIAQTFTMVAKGGVQLGFIARAQALTPPYNKTGSFWHIPTHLHQPIKQDGVILKTARNLKIATQFKTFLTSPDSNTLIANAGFSNAK